MKQKYNCSKCKITMTDMELNGQPFCENCILERTTKNFNKILSRGLDTKGRFGKASDYLNIMVAYSDSLASKCCSKLLENYLHNRPQVGKIVLCNVGDNSDGSLKNSNFPLIYKSLIIEGTHSKDSYAEIYNLKRTETLYDTAIDENCNILLFCHDTEHLASHLLTQVVLGNANGIENFEIFEIKTVKEMPLKIIYPLQECTQQELINYAAINNISYEQHEYPKDDFASLTKSFLFLQQKEKASTCSIITKTIAKVKTTHNTE